MKFIYRLTKEDLLVHLLYKNRSLRKKLPARSVTIILILFLLSMDRYKKDGFDGAIVLISITTIVFIYYSFFIKYVYRYLYKVHIDKKLARKADKEIVFQIEGEYLYLKDNISECKLLLSAVEEVHEIGKYFFLETSHADSIVIPKRAIENNSTFKLFLRNLDVEYNENLKWKW